MTNFSHQAKDSHMILIKESKSIIIGYFLSDLMCGSPLPSRRKRDLSHTTTFRIVLAYYVVQAQLQLAV